MANDGYFRDYYMEGGDRIRCRCTACGSELSIIRGFVSEEPCDNCGAQGIWREETDDEYAELIFGENDCLQPLSARITSELKISLADNWSAQAQAELVECLEAFGDGRLARWLRSKLKDPLKRDWIARILNDFYTRDFLKRVGKLVERTMRLNAMESRTNPARSVNLYLREATRCCVFGFWDSSVALSRAAVELALKDRLKEKLGKLVPSNDEMKMLLEYAQQWRLIDGAHFALGDEVRRAGNDVLHHGSHANEDVAWHSLAAARGVLNHLYSRP
jgi:predicted RNA-binding Zn-ribbon protein involved in translation (DUF1610 family)